MCESISNGPVHDAVNAEKLWGENGKESTFVGEARLPLPSLAKRWGR